ncbi:hypothetical protein VNO77_08123 [Canavalia gladiata]|uniref:Uncharacterized protein n=1 Tax=Canavalia gladiata TaxID=3824 RepID=A0AAN9M8Z9_CANGL
MQDSKAGPLWLRGQYAYHYTVSPVDVIMSFSRFNIIPHVHTPIVSIALTAPLSPLASNFASSWGLHKVASRGLLILVERGNRTPQLGCSVGTSIHSLIHPDLSTGLFECRGKVMQLMQNVATGSSFPETKILPSSKVRINLSEVHSFPPRGSLPWTFEGNTVVPR